MSDTKDDKNKKDQLKDELNLLMSGFNSIFKDQDGNDKHQSDVVDQKMNELRGWEKIDFKELNPKFKKQAISVINTMYDFYLDLDLIDQNEYAKKKRDLFSMNLSAIFFQLKTIKVVLERLAENITSGNVNARTIEVFGTLQDKFSNIIKTHANYILFVEDSLKKLQRDYENKPTPIGETSTNGMPRMDDKVSKKEAESEYYVSANQQKLLKDVEEVDPLFDEIELEEVGEKQTNPDNKPELMRELNVDESLTVNEDEEDLDDYETIMGII